MKGKERRGRKDGMSIALNLDEINRKKNVIKVICTLHKYIYEEISDPFSLNLVYQAFVDDIINEKSDDGIVCCYYGFYFNINKNYEKKFYWTKKSADLGNSWGLNNLGLCYNFKEGGSLRSTKQDYETAFELFGRSANLGNHYGMCHLGNCYYYGEGTIQDYKLAFYWYNKSANLGNCYGMNNLGDCYYFGKGIGTNERDYKSAFYWYEKSANLGNCIGTYNLGNCCYSGEGTTQDYKLAFYW